MENEIKPGTMSVFDRMKIDLENLLPLLEIPDMPEEIKKPVCIDSQEELDQYQKAVQERSDTCKSISDLQLEYNKQVNHIYKNIPEWNIWFPIMIRKETYFISKDKNEGSLVVLLSKNPRCVKLYPLELLKTSSMFLEELGIRILEVD